MTIPKLRFPEFRDEGEWEEARLIRIADRITQRNSDNNVSRVLSNSAVDGVVDQRDYFDKDIANQDNLQNYFIVDKGDYVYNPRVSTTAPVGPISKNKIGKGVMSPLYTVFRFHSSMNDFFEHFFHTNIWHKYLKEVSNSGARHDRMALSNEDFMNMPLPFPNQNEQQKIADCLTSLDDLITIHNHKLAALKTHKKGLMQQLFPAEGETVPKLRFKEFQEEREWIQLPMKEVYSFKGNNTLSRDKLNYVYGSTRNIHYGDIHTKFATLFNIENEMVPYINESEINQSIKSENYCMEGDIIFADASEDLKDVGKSIEIINLNGEAVVSGLHTILARQISPKILVGGFGGYLFKSPWIRKQVQKESQGAKVLGISSSRLANINIQFPSDKAEQRKIVNCISFLDTLISIQIKKVQALKLHKKGLMQQLFPRITEVTA